MLFLLRLAINNTDLMSLMRRRGSPSGSMLPVDLSLFDAPKIDRCINHFSILYVIPAILGTAFKSI